MDVKELRAELGLTQSELAYKCGVTIRTVQNWESGGVIPQATLKFLDILKNNHENDSRTRPSAREEGVPYYDVDFIGGFNQVYNDQTMTPSYMINFPPYNRATCWCNITGHSMEPEISSGDIIALRQIPDWRFLVYGEIYAIVTRNDLRTVKRLGPGTTPDTFTLIPTNKSPEYVAQEIDKADILHVYQVIGCMKKF